MVEVVARKDNVCVAMPLTALILFGMYRFSISMGTCLILRKERFRVVACLILRKERFRVVELTKI